MQGWLPFGWVPMGASRCSTCEKLSNKEGYIPDLAIDTLLNNFPLVAHPDNGTSSRGNLDDGSLNMHENTVAAVLFSHHLLILAKLLMCAVEFLLPCLRCHLDQSTKYAARHFLFMCTITLALALAATLAATSFLSKAASLEISSAHMPCCVFNVCVNLPCLECHRVKTQSGEGQVTL